MGKQRITSEEKRAIESSKYDDYNDARRAAEAHRQVNLFIYFLLFNINYGILGTKTYSKLGKTWYDYD